MVLASVGACCMFAGLPDLPLGSCLSTGADDDGAVAPTLVFGVALVLGSGSCL